MDSQRDRLARAFAIRFLLLPLHQLREVPALAVAFELQRRLDQLDLVEDDALRDELEDAVVDLDGLGRDDTLAGDVDRDVADLDAEQQVAADPADRQLAVQILLRLADDVAAQPVAEPGRLRHDQREGDDAHHQRADQRDDLENLTERSHSAPRRARHVLVHVHVHARAVTSHVARAAR